MRSLSFCEAKTGERSEPICRRQYQIKVFNGKTGYFQPEYGVNFVKGWGKERSGYKTWLGNEASENGMRGRWGTNQSFQGKD